MNQTKRITELAELVIESVSDLPSKGRYEGIRTIIPLSTPQGRWELVALGTLLAARVTEEVAEDTFLTLRDEGLLDFRRLCLGGDISKARVGATLSSKYRAPISVVRKLDALFANARLIADKWGGDVDNIYRYFQAEAEGSVGVLAELQQLQQIQTQALWICRSMYEAGLWPELVVADRAYIDVNVRRALSRLGLLHRGDNWQETKQGMAEVIAEMFGGDPTPLFKLGRYRCLPSSAVVCQVYCKACPYCEYREPVRELMAISVNGEQ